MPATVFDNDPMPTRAALLGWTIASLEARLGDADGNLAATATSSARLVPVEKLAARG